MYLSKKNKNSQYLSMLNSQVSKVKTKSKTGSKNLSVHMLLTTHLTILQMKKDENVGNESLKSFAAYTRRVM